MSEQLDKGQLDIDDLLARRAGVMMKPDLTERIIHAAMRTPQSTSGHGGFSVVVTELLSCFILPRPALSLAVCLLIGVTGGWLTNISPSPSYESDDVFDLVVINEEGWL